MKDFDASLQPLQPLQPVRLALILGLCLTAAGCRIERQLAPGEAAAPGSGQAAAPAGFDPKGQVEQLWEAKVIPTLSSRAGEFTALRKAIQANIDGAGAAHGFRERGEGAPWNMATKLKGRIVTVDTESSAATLGVDADGDGKADARVQIGPVVRGTALRDSLPFISFTAYTNQIEFAQIANALNDKAQAAAMKPLPRENLKGRQIELLGVFTAADADEPPLVTPVQASLAGGAS